MNEKIKILVCAHKQDYSKSDDIYMPIHAGKACANIDLGFQGDDTGDNISEKNPNYCELTVHYWAWKNLKNIDYIGLCHYRRYFDLSSIKVGNNFNFEKIFSKYDAILTKPSYTPYSNLFHLINGTTIEDAYIFINILYSHYPEYKKAAIDYLCNSNGWVGCNMLITSKPLFEKYTKCLFDILFLFEKQIKMSEYTRLKRIFGYIGEVFLPIYCIANHLNVKYLPIVDNPDIKMKKGFYIKDYINKFRYKICFKIMQPSTVKNPIVADSIHAGFNKDNLKLHPDLVNGSI